MRPLRALLISQFFGAFNDNAWKLFVIVLAERALAGASESALQTKTMLAFVVFALPLMAFSLPAGLVADRVSKRTVILATKSLEVALMTAGTLVLFLAPGSQPLLLTILGLMGLQSALFAPAKYGILPELVPHAQLSAANGALELWTFFAIIGGTALAGPLLAATGSLPGIAGLVLTALAGAGLVAARGIPAVPPARADRPSFAETVGGAWRAVRADRPLWLAILGATWFWGIASLLGQNLLVYSKTVLDLSEAQKGVPLALYGVGVGAGSFLAGKLSHGKVETGLVPLGALGLGFFTLLMGLWGPGLFFTLVFMTLLGISSGFLIVPLDALLQWRAPAERRGSVIALGNVFVFAGMLGGSLLGWRMGVAGLSTQGILVGAALITFLGTAWALWLLPEAFLRLLVFLWTRTVYRMHVIDREHVPLEGGALLTPNHVSFMDGLFLTATLDRPVRFIVDEEQFERPLFRPFLKILGAIPVAAAGGTRNVLRALREAGKALDEGELVCIFPEGQITRTGTMLPFRRGLERIVKGRDTVIVPVHLDRVWGSIFSFSSGRFGGRLPEEIPYPVTVSFGAPLPATTPLAEVRQAVTTLDERAWYQRKQSRSPLHRTFRRVARRRPWRLAAADPQRRRLSRLGLLAGGVALARALRERWEGQSHVGLLLPPSVAGATATLAASLAGRTSVPLNYTAGTAGMGSAVEQAGLRTIVTSRAFLEKANLELPEGATPIFLEDVAPAIGAGARALAVLLSIFAPDALLERACGAERAVEMDDVATVIFSSGSTGEPKGVMLTHFNLDSNVEQVGQVIRLDASDRLLGILPLFHSFGSMALWFALNRGAPIVFHANPLDAPVIGKLTYDYALTILLATPTFLQLYLRRCSPEEFGSLRIVLVGAERLTESLATAFEDRFGLRPLEGYGTSECSPVIACGVPSFRARGFYQAGSRRGWIGPPLPGVAARIVDPETFEPRPPDEPGMLLVRGPNLMKGYLGREDRTAAVMRDGWYVTGDIAVLDREGFLRITDRLSRFAKIGGEMVPHAGVEEALHRALGEEPAAPVFAVTSLPDERKGERLAVLHTTDEARIPDLLERMAREGLPNLFLPRPDHFVRVDAIPLLGTGKTDLREVKRRAAEALA